MASFRTSTGRSIAASVAWLTSAAFVIGLVPITIGQLPSSNNDGTCGNLFDGIWRNSTFCTTRMHGYLRIEAALLAVSTGAAVLWWYLHGRERP